MSLILHFDLTLETCAGAEGRRASEPCKRWRSSVTKSAKDSGRCLQNKCATICFHLKGHLTDDKNSLHVLINDQNPEAGDPPILKRGAQFSSVSLCRQIRTKTSTHTSFCCPADCLQASHINSGGHDFTCASQFFTRRYTGLPGSPTLCCPSNRHNTHPPAELVPSTS